MYERESVLIIALLWETSSYRGEWLLSFHHQTMYVCMCVPVLKLMVHVYDGNRYVCMNVCMGVWVGSVL